MTIGSHRKLLQETYMGNNEKYNYDHVGFIYFFKDITEVAEKKIR